MLTDHKCSLVEPTSALRDIVCPAAQSDISICGSTEWFDLDQMDNFDRDNDPDCIIGNRWICKGGSLIVQGYSGIGKSSLLLQMALLWATGKDFFGLKPVRPLRTVFVQAENDKGDFSEPYQDITGDFSEEDRTILKENFNCGREAEITGAEEFGKYLEELIELFSPDILFFDPLLSYFGDDIIKQQSVSRFFRNTIQKIQNRTGVVIVFNHHLGKPTQGAPRVGPAHYQGLGSSDIVNWSRETITLSEADEGFYVLTFGKRATRAGFSELCLRHSETGVRWELLHEAAPGGNIQAISEHRRLERIAEYIREKEAVTLQQMKALVRRFNYGQNAIKSALDTLVKNTADTDQPIYYFEAHVNGHSRMSGIYSISPRPVNGHVKLM